MNGGVEEKSSGVVLPVKAMAKVPNFVSSQEPSVVEAIKAMSHEWV